MLKTITDGMDVGVLLMSQARWEGEGWTCDRVVAKMEEFILPLPSVDNVTSRWYSRWGVKYERHGRSRFRVRARFPGSGVIITELN